MSELSTAVVDVVRKIIVESAYGNLLGAQMVSCDRDAVTLRMPYRPEVTTLGDTVHGGAIASLIDVAATAAFWSSDAIPAGSRGSTISLAVNYLSAARGADLTARASVRRRGREILVGDVSVVDPESREVAAALVTYKLSAPPSP
jgi:uncharacterized protein (TIGR00369 family)